ncbi:MULTISPECIES: ComEA family DNA-binding protein [Staphylococcus]|uniref:ComEA family DNA-binding protein n=1 Tax=Staphylococcus TaxID=1279 RepID=UPI000763D796|nr:MULTISPECIES: ComEA family DNA-binding protein [Staphylococcus]KXA41038.1 comEA protein [Staphylococcus simulans]OFM20464.1 comEA protein [Staphylococcus sp. HMSC059E03]OFU75432.1 comEA protein [Staphylococcus sp. HMSC10C03]OFV04896.1 comEA protein [Staphylococcus sp. HMSC12H08]OHR56023.1 comEA protein [Staphylococcus sp. HMSC070A03]
MLEQLKHYYNQYKHFSWLLVIAVIVLAFILMKLHSDSSNQEIESTAQNVSNSHLDNDKQNFSKKKESNKEADTETEANRKTKVVVVDVKGAVEHPDIYEMKDNQRIKDVLNKAKLTSKADLTTINLSEKLTDQKMIFIPEKGQNLTTSSSISTSSTQSTNKSPQTKVNLNSAKENELTTVNGLGPSKAKAIIEFRETKGPFNSVDQLKNVKGIGEKSFEKLKEYFTV